MTGYKKIFVDTAIFVYCLEHNPNYYDKAADFFSYCYSNNIALVTSNVTVAEYCIYPFKTGQNSLVEKFESFLDLLNIEVVDIDRKSAKQAAKTRALYTSFKGMDTLQLGAAISENCDLFVTNDKQLLQTAEIKCILLDSFQTA